MFDFDPVIAGLNYRRRRVGDRATRPGESVTTDPSDPISPDERPSAQVLRVQVPDDKDGERLDRFLASALEDLSRTRLQALIAEGQVRRDSAGVTDNPRHKVVSGDWYEISVPASREGTPQAQDIPLDILYEDEHLIAIDKPAGMVVHPAAGHPDGTLVNALLAHCGPSFANVGGAARPGIVHRLDVGTSGVMIAAKTEKAYLALTAMFAAHDLERSYEALVWGRLQTSGGMIEGAIGRSPTNRKKMAIVRRGGKPARTHFKVLQTFGDIASHVRCTLETGRTHQIRVHLTHIGHPIIGDPTYGSGRNKSRSRAVFGDTADAIDRPLLHAVTLSIRHPVTGDELKFVSDKPRIFKEITDILKRS